MFAVVTTAMRRLASSDVGQDHNQRLFRFNEEGVSTVTDASAHVSLYIRERIERDVHIKHVVSRQRNGIARVIDGYACAVVCCASMVRRRRFTA